MQDEITDFPSVLALLNESGLRYVLIGGLAMAAHGSAHLTFDIDISYPRTPQDIDALMSVLRRCHARMRGLPPDLPSILDERTLKNMTNLTLQTDLGDFDILAEPEGVDNFEGLWERATYLPLFDLQVRVASIEDLIAMKRAANRPKDQTHVLELLEIQKLIREESAAYSASRSE